MPHSLPIDEDCGELVSWQDARVDADVLIGSLSNGFPTYSFAECAGYTDEEGRPCSKTSGLGSPSQASKYMQSIKHPGGPPGFLKTERRCGGLLYSNAKHV